MLGMAKKILISVLMAFTASAALAQSDGPALRPEELLARMTKLQQEFERHKPAEAAKVEGLFPEAMDYLSQIQSAKLDNRVRIAAAVKLAIATVPFDETIPAGDVLCMDYRDNKAIYEEEINRNGNEADRNRLLISLKGYAETLKELEKADKKTKSAPAKKKK
jgi:hypothetical protein